MSLGSSTNATSSSWASHSLLKSSLGFNKEHCTATVIWVEGVVCVEAYFPCHVH
jgi:hypothetical protein